MTELQEMYDQLHVTHQVVSVEVAAPAPSGADYYIACRSAVKVGLTALLF